jgi:beta-aspartyl-peptidase (threonine type)
MVLRIIAVLVLLGSGLQPAGAGDCAERATFVLLVHGGAGSGEQPAEQRRARRQVLERVLRAGAEQLRAGATAVAAVESAIATLEDAPQFNAGRGGIPNKAGFVELDASIMDGRDRNAGAVAAVRRIKNPIRAARAVMERSEHLLFVDRGAVAFAEAAGLELAPADYFLVPENQSKPSKAGTVGAVALDRCGHLAAGTSTGGYVTKTPGRVGDSPIIGAGTYAADASCAVSATGWGEYFIRYAAAHDVAALVEYKGLAVGPAAERVLAKIKAAGATGGLIVLDRQGHMAWPHTSQTMLRGYSDHRGRIEIGEKKIQIERTREH